MPSKAERLNKMAGSIQIQSVETKEQRASNEALTYHLYLLRMGITMSIGNEEVKKILDVIDGVRTGHGANLSEMHQLVAEIEKRIAEIKSCPELYAEQISQFTGSGPKGIYQALMEEREQERELERKRERSLGVPNENKT